MKQEEKQLLLADLCGRLPYHPKVRVNGIDAWLTLAVFNDIVQSNRNFSLYLRPISSMTEEEAGELSAIEPSAIVYGVPEPEMIRITDDTNNFGVKLDAVQKVIDWLDRKMFDWRGLIPLGLALPAKEGMYGKET